MPATPATNPNADCHAAPAARSRIHPRRRLAGAVTLAVLASLLAYGAAILVFQRAPLNADENSYVLQAHNFVAGRLARPHPPCPESFHGLMIIICPDVGWLSRYPPGQALLLAPGVLIGDLYLPVALAAGLSVFLLYLSGLMLGGHRTGLLAGGLLLVSPSFILYHGTLLSHSSAVLAATLMLAGYIHWRKNSCLATAVLAGLAWGWLYNNRTFTALLLALPLAIDSLAGLYRERTGRMLLATAGFAAASVLGMVALLLYNARAVGDPWTMTYLYYTPTQNLGFGIRHYGRIHHTFTRGWSILGTHVRLLNTWLWGFPGSLLLAAGLVGIGWKRGWSRLLIGLALVVWFGYIGFWYAGPREAGPAYYLETLPFIVLAAAFGLETLIRRLPRWLLAMGLAGFLVINGLFLVKAATPLRAANTPRRQVLKTLRDAPRNSLVFIHPDEHPAAFAGGNDMIINPRGLDGDVLVARWRDGANQALMRSFSQRTALVLKRDGNGTPYLAPMPHRLHVAVPVGALRARTGETATDEAARTDPIRTARQGVHAPGLMAYGRSFQLYPGRFALDFEVLAAPGPNGIPSMMLEIRSDGERSILDSVTVGSCETWTVKRLEFELDAYETIEPRVTYFGYGDAAIASITLQELDPCTDTTP